MTEADETAAFYLWWNEKRCASYAVHAAAYSRNESMPDSWGRFSELAEKEAWLACAKQQGDEIERLQQARDQWKDNYQTLLEAKVPTPQECDGQ